MDNIRSKDDLSFVLRSVLGTKYSGYENLLAPMVAEACLSVMPPAPKKPSVNVDSVRVCKLQGGTIDDSKVLKGMVITRQVLLVADRDIYQCYHVA